MNKPPPEVPERMARLDRDHRGYPIFFMAYRDAQGRPHFTINDERKRQIVIARDLCSICGGPLLRGRWFVGGALSAFDPDGAYVDPPMHQECSHYALRVCPYLASPQWSRYIERGTLRSDDPVTTGLDPAVIDKRPDVFVAVMATGQRQIMGQIAPGGEAVPIRTTFVQYLKPRRPYVRVEYWRNGAQITEAEARAVLHGR